MIRIAGKKDWPAISDISRRSGYEDYINEVGLEYLSTGEVLVFEDPRIEGFTKIEFLPDNSAWFSGLRVDPNFWRKGIATALTEASFQRAMEVGCTMVRLLVYDDNSRSLNLVSKLGFNEVSRFRFFMCPPDLNGFSETKDKLSGYLNLHWKFADISRESAMEFSIYTKDCWKIALTGENTYQILEMGKGKLLTGAGWGFTSIDITNLSDSSYSPFETGVETSTGLILEKDISLKND